MPHSPSANVTDAIPSFTITMVDPYRRDFLENSDLPADVKKAFLTRTQAEGTHWDDEYARSLGFQKSTVSGGVIKDHVMIALTNAWGEKWFERGDFTMRFRRPLYDRDLVEVRFTEPRDEDGARKVDFSVVNENGEACVVGWAALPHTTPKPPSLEEFLTSPLATSPIVTVRGEEFVGQRWESDTVDIPADTTARVRAGDAAFGPDIQSKILSIYAGLDSRRSELREKTLLPAWVIGVGPRRGVDDSGEVFAMATVHEEKSFAPVPIEEPLTVHNRLAGAFERKGAKYIVTDHLVVTNQDAVVAWRRWTVMVRPAGVQA